MHLIRQTAFLRSLIVSFVPAWLAAGDLVFWRNGVTAHRGNSGEFPENTLPAFAGGIDVGADWIELDVVKTADGQLAVIHDLTTKATGDVDRTVTESTYQQLVAIDVATGFRKKTGKSLAECPPQKIPLLREVIELVMRQNRCRVSIQPKQIAFATRLL